MLSPCQVAQPNPQLSRPVSSGHHISLEHRPWRKHLELNSDTNAGNEKYSAKKEKEGKMKK